MGQECAAVDQSLATSRPLDTSQSDWCGGLFQSSPIGNLAAFFCRPQHMPSSRAKAGFIDVATATRPHWRIDFLPTVYQAGASSCNRSVPPFTVSRPPPSSSSWTVTVYRNPISAAPFSPRQADAGSLVRRLSEHPAVCPPPRTRHAFRRRHGEFRDWPQCHRHWPGL